MVDLVAHLVHVHTEPKDGRYRKVERFWRGEVIRMQQFADIQIAVDHFLRG